MTIEERLKHAHKYQYPVHVYATIGDLSTQYSGYIVDDWPHGIRIKHDGSLGHKGQQDLGYDQIRNLVLSRVGVVLGES